MKRTLSIALAGLALILGLSLSFAPKASAQQYGPPPVYSTWQPQWDRFEYDRHHVILGSVVHFRAYRVTVQRPDGNVQTIDLKNGTVIHPIGATPHRGDRIAIYGYYSNGTFIANGLVLR
ncbi:MAG: hypothetical protein ABR949_13880 [Candidatus Aquilonibacter sp.]|jgi:hypothetical protein